MMWSGRWRILANGRWLTLSVCVLRFYSKSNEKLGTNTRIWGILHEGDRRSEHLEEGRKAGFQCKSLVCFIFYFWSAGSRGGGLGMAMIDLILWTLTLVPCFHLILEWGSPVSADRLLLSLLAILQSSGFFFSSWSQSLEKSEKMPHFDRLITPS
jgi:hypothetical protein